MSTGRGGIGNIRRNSLSPDERFDGPDDSSRSRGRDPVGAYGVVTYSVGRGGAGNLRSPSCSPSRGSCEQEREVLSCAAEREGVAPHSTGNGGLENITHSVSRDSPHPPNCDSKSLVDEGKIRKVLHVANPGSDEDEKLHRRKKELLRGVLHQTGREHVANLPADNSLEHAPSTFVAGSERE
ncbi:hypothetical protein BDQ17DRAFT_1379593 [Cyathus striatus]|nr:hypothetical protein BDQ17DRAFT_1379593 [Cyathus striatus]